MPHSVDMAPGTAPKSTLLMPLYIYPVADTTWGKLYDSLSGHPDVSFCVVVNPNSGPGGLQLPGLDYQREVPRLNRYANCQTIGYVKIDWCNRPLQEVYDEIETYALWSQRSGDADMYVEGILIDEAPNRYTEERAEYLRAVREFVRAQDGIRGSRLVAENPGTPPDAGLLVDGGPDVVVTCEEPHVRMVSDEIQKYYRDNEIACEKTGYMVSGIPLGQVRAVVRDLQDKSAYIFATDLVDDFYESFGPSWDDFVAAFEDQEVAVEKHKAPAQEEEAAGVVEEEEKEEAAVVEGSVIAKEA